jgi:hypothetical protein
MAVLVTAAAGALLVVRERARSESKPTDQADELALVTVRTDDTLLPAVVGNTGFGATGALVIPPSAIVVVPGQGESTVEDALELEPRPAATAISNLLGVWIDDTATLKASQVAEVTDETSGVEIGGDATGGAEVSTMLGEPDQGGVASLQIVLKALAAAGASWDASDLADADNGGHVADALSAVSESNVVTLETDEVASGVFRSSAEQVSRGLVDAFGGPAAEATPVIVLNGNGVPGVGERVAERLIPGGFRVALSQNAAEFGHPKTLIVVGSPDDVGLAERVRDLLGVGSISVSVGSGIAPVTVVVGEDFSG